MTRKEARERREMMARAWNMDKDGRPAFPSRVVARMFRTSTKCAGVMASQNRDLFRRRPSDGSEPGWAES